jgi:antitoxin (DNA-binding transcriptional repressor) of toxin-antitoxin stability system
MKTAAVREFSIREVRQSFQRVLRWIGNGETVVITNRRRPVARILPPESAAASGRQVTWDFLPRLKKQFPKPLTFNPVARARADERW